MCLELVGRVVEMASDQEGIAIVEVDGTRRRVSLVLLSLDGVSVSPGDWLATHTGLAVRVLEPQEARDVLDQRNELRAASSEGET